MAVYAHKLNDVMNSINIIGNLTADIVCRDIKDKCKLSFTLAHSQNDKTSYIPVEIWNQRHLTQYLGKGSRVAVEGQLVQESWDGEDGAKKSKLYVRANAVHFVDLKAPQAAASEGGRKRHSSGGGHRAA
ncbi:MAG: single-stranded DNA-binding protein [Verrucomicrobia bacterium]|nr:single-stranded DNA-binding protein [Verrucomicrobiota bacterium]